MLTPNFNGKKIMKTVNERIKIKLKTTAQNNPSKWEIIYSRMAVGFKMRNHDVI